MSVSQDSESWETSIPLKAATSNWGLHQVPNTGPHVTSKSMALSQEFSGEKSPTAGSPREDAWVDQASQCVCVYVRQSRLRVSGASNPLKAALSNRVVHQALVTVTGPRVSSESSALSRSIRGKGPQHRARSGVGHASLRVCVYVCQSRLQVIGAQQSP